MYNLERHILIQNQTWICYHHSLTISQPLFIALLKGQHDTFVDSYWSLQFQIWRCRRSNSGREFYFPYNCTSLFHTSGIWIERHDDTLQSVVWCTDLRYSLRRTCLVGRARKWWMRTWLWSGWDLLDQILREDLVAELNLPSLQKTEPSFRHPSNFHRSHWIVSWPGYHCS